jgi:hypothetical protein
MNRTIASIVDELGGTVEVADASGVVPSAVTQWKDKNSVPKWHRESILKLAKKKKVGLTLEEIVSPATPDAAAA